MASPTSQIHSEPIIHMSASYQMKDCDKPVNAMLTDFLVLIYYMIYQMIHLIIYYLFKVPKWK